MNEIIDCHIHPGFDETVTNWYGIALTPKEQMETLKRAGITKACGSVIKRMKPTSFDEIIELNDIALKIRDQYPDFYIPGITIHPHFVKESCKEIDRCCGEHGLRWIGELVGYFMEYGNEYATDSALEIMRHIESYNAAVNIHCGDLEIVDALCSQCPNLNIILAHPGLSKNEVEERAYMVAKHDNLHMDISGAGTERFGAIRRLIDIAGSHKILFGTDHPINNPEGILHNLLSEPLSDDEKEQLLSKNFLRLTGGNL